MFGGQGKVEHVLELKVTEFTVSAWVTGANASVERTPRPRTVTAKAVQMELRFR